MNVLGRGNPYTYTFTLALNWLKNNKPEECVHHMSEDDILDTIEDINKMIDMADEIRTSLAYEYNKRKQ